MVIFLVFEYLRGKGGRVKFLIFKVDFYNITIYLLLVYPLILLTFIISENIWLNNYIYNGILDQIPL